MCTAAIMMLSSDGSLGITRLIGKGVGCCFRSCRIVIFMHVWIDYEDKVTGST